MRNQTTLSAVLCGGATLFASSSVFAGYQGLGMGFSQAIVGGQLRNVYKVYAFFSDPNDAVTVVFGSPQQGPMGVVSRNDMDTGPGSNFFNPITSHGTAPTATEVFGGIDGNTNPIPAVANAAYDTFFTIGVGAGQSGSGLNGANETGSQSMAADFINGNLFFNGDGGWFTNGPVPQGRAGWTGDGDLLLRVLIMQLTVSSTSTVRGTVNIAGINNTALAGEQSFVLSGQTFGWIPAPGALSAFAIAGLLGARRRRG